MRRIMGSWITPTIVLGLAWAAVAAAQAPGAESGADAGDNAHDIRLVRLLAALALLLGIFLLVRPALTRLARAARLRRVTAHAAPPPAATVDDPLRLLVWYPLEEWWRSYLEGYRRRLASAPPEAAAEAHAAQVRQVTEVLGRPAGPLDAFHRAFRDWQTALAANEGSLAQLNLRLPISQATRAIEDNRRSLEQEIGALEANLGAQESVVEQAKLFFETVRRKGLREWLDGRPPAGANPPRPLALLEEYAEDARQALQARAEQMEAWLSVRGNPAQLKDRLAGQLGQVLRAGLQLQESVARLNAQCQDPPVRAALPSETLRGVQELSRAGRELLEAAGLREIPAEEGVSFRDLVAKYASAHPRLSENWYGATGEPATGGGAPGAISKVMRRGWYWSALDGGEALLIEPCLARLWAASPTGAEAAPVPPRAEEPTAPPPVSAPAAPEPSPSPPEPEPPAVEWEEGGWDAQPTAAAPSAPPPPPAEAPPPETPPPAPSDDAVTSPGARRLRTPKREP